GWASGPTSWLTQYVLGINVLEPGCKKIKIEPHLGDLKWVEGTFPTPYGLVSVKHRKNENGKIITTYKAPKGVKVIL
ncbi:MAG: alpha-L-rhamnosidase C-terminal domain-containing protein, partial [Bacteroidota bacterium]|nr:alpha-L-rhamnosidase C-terminal domain-containing protein [Bacteroidota bacterium]